MRPNDPNVQYHFGRVIYGSNPKQKEAEVEADNSARISPCDDPSDMHRMMSQKIIDLSKQITQLTAQNEEADQNLLSVTMWYESEVQRIVTDADFQICKAADQAAESANNAWTAKLAALQDYLDEERLKAHQGLQQLREDVTSREHQSIKAWSKKYGELRMEVEQLHQQIASQANIFTEELRRRHSEENATRAAHAEELARVQATQARAILEATASLEADLDTRLAEGLQAEKAVRERLQEELEIALAHAEATREKENSEKQELEVKLHDAQIELTSLREEIFRCKTLEAALTKATAHIEKLHLELQIVHEELDAFKEQNHSLLDEVEMLRDIGVVKPHIPDSLAAARREVMRCEEERAAADAAVDVAVQAAANQIEDLWRSRRPEAKITHASLAKLTGKDGGPCTGTLLDGRTGNPGLSPADVIMSENRRHFKRDDSPDEHSPACGNVVNAGHLHTENMQRQPPHNVTDATLAPNQSVDITEFEAAHARLIGMASRGFSIARSLSARQAHRG